MKRNSLRSINLNDKIFFHLYFHTYFTPLRFLLYEYRQHTTGGQARPIILPLEEISYFLIILELLRLIQNSAYAPYDFKMGVAVEPAVRPFNN